jgi:hypothetical protein
MEVVSPKLNTKDTVTGTLSEFWEAMMVHFDMRKEPTCGGHVHVTPLNASSKFSMQELRNIAFATVVYEDFVNSVLPPARRGNRYCSLNSQTECGLRRTLVGGKSTESLQSVAAAIRSKLTESELHSYMQNGRYVLWNFQNIFPDARTGRCTGTVEFRGGSQFLNTMGTLRWIAFVLGFITLALKEVCALPVLVHIMPQ